jgi:hypothetical protein
MTTLFEWLYILFCNYPKQLGPTVEKVEDECCDAACRRANEAMRGGSSGSSGETNKIAAPQCASRMPHRCISEPLARALEHVKRQISTVSYMAAAQEQGVTVGSYINRHLVQPVYENMLGDDVQNAVDFYTFSKVCWYMIMLRNLTQLLLQSAEQHAQSNSTLTTRSPEALRALQQLQKSFLEPVQAEKHLVRCDCYEGGPRGLDRCLQRHLPGWSSSSDAIKHVHFARQLWDVKTESLPDTVARIEGSRAGQKHK